MGERDYKKQLELLSKDPENKTCVDCGAIQPKWISMYYGTFLCLNCAGSHRSLGVFLDSVKSIGFDSWDKESVLPVKYGGNKRFKEHLEQLEVSYSSTEDKYNSKKVIEYSAELSELIERKSGIRVRSASSSADAGNRRKMSEPIELCNRMYKSREYTNSTGNLTSSLSGISSIIVKHAGTFKDKTMKYGSKIGSTVSSGAKHLANAGSAIVSGIKKVATKQSEEKGQKGKSKSSRSKEYVDWS